MRNRKIYGLLLLAIVIFPLFIQAQEKKVSGIIIERGSGKAIAGAALKLRNGKGGTTTDAKGNFEINVNDRANTVSLQISSIGFRAIDTVLTLGAGHRIELVSAAIGIDEVVVSTGYSAIPKERATGSFSFVGKDRINEQINLCTFFA